MIVTPSAMPVMLPQYHAADVIQRQRIAEPVALFNARHHAEKLAIVQQAVMGQRGRFRRSGGAGGELNIDRVIRLQQAGQFSQPGELRRTAERRMSVNR